MTKSKVYKEPVYYEIAFGFVDPVEQVNLIENFIEQYSERSVERFLDIACGPGLQILEIAERGFDAVALDNSPEMLDYLELKAEEKGVSVSTVQSDMRNFDLKSKVDCAFIMMGTINLVESNEDFLRHLDSVGSSMKKGGLYLMENFAGLGWFNEDIFNKTSWKEARNGIKVDASYETVLLDSMDQKVRETMKLKVDDNGEEMKFEEIEETKLIFPQELEVLVRMNGSFEMVGWFEQSSTKELEKPSTKNIVVLRKK